MERRQAHFHSATPVAEICRRLRNGESCRVTAKAVRVDPNTVLSVRKSLLEKESLPYPKTGQEAHGWQIRRPFGAHAPIAEEIKRAVLSESVTITNPQVAKIYGVSLAWVKKFRRENGVSSPGASGKLKGLRYKTQKREIAEDALLCGDSVQSAANKSGFSLTHTRLIRNELGLGKAQNRSSFQEAVRIVGRAKAQGEQVDCTWIGRKPSA